MNHTICQPINECRHTGYEKLQTFLCIDKQTKVRLYLDNFGQYRIVLFKLEKGISSVLVGTDKTIRYKFTMPGHTGNNYTRQLQGLLSVWGIVWKASDYQTKAGLACYG